MDGKFKKKSHAQIPFLYPTVRQSNQPLPPQVFFSLLRGQWGKIRKKKKGKKRKKERKKNQL